MQNVKITEVAHHILEKHINSNSIIIDATCGNGHDTLFLAQRVKLVHAFDVQEVAINHTKALTKDYNNVIYHHTSHENITELIPDYDGIIFNLGYLPGSDKKILTNYVTTIHTLDLIHDRHKGFVLIVAYPGHTEGLMESVAITSWLDKNRIKYEIIKTSQDTEKEPPFIYFWNYDNQF